MSDVFISYSRKNSDFARKITDRLRQSGKDSWVDWEGIPLSSPNWWNEIKTGIDNADNFVFIMSPDSMKSVVCNMELDYALDLYKRVILVMHEESNTDVALASLEDFIPDAAMQERLEGEDIITKAQDNLHRISHINWLFFRDEDDFETAYEQLLTTVETDLNYVKSHTRYLARARDWQENGKRVDLLLFGEEITLAEKWLAQGDKYVQDAVARASGHKISIVNPIPDALHREYIKESRKAQNEQQQYLQDLENSRIRSEKSRQRAQRVGMIAGIIGIIAVIASIFAGLQAAEARNSASTAVEKASIAEQDANQSNTQVAVANATLEPIPTILTDAANQLGNANTQVAVANATLTPIPPTLTEVANQLDDAITQLDNAQATRQAIEIFSKSVQIAASVPDIFDSLSQPLALSLALEASVIDDTDHASRVLSEIAYEPNVRQRYENWDSVPDSIKNNIYNVGAEITHWERDDNTVISPNGELSASIYNSTVQLWDVNSGEIIREFTSNATDGRSVTFSADGSLLATGWRDDAIIIWDVNTGKRLHQLNGHTQTVPRVRFTMDGSQLLSFGEDNTVFLWDLEQGNIIRHDSGFSGSVYQAIFSESGDKILAVSNGGSIIVHDTLTGEIIKSYPNQNLGRFYDVAYSPDEDSFVVASSYGVYILDSDTGDIIQEFPDAPVAMSSVDFSPNGDTIASSSWSYNSFYLWDASTGQLIHEFGGYSNRVLSVKYSPDGQYLVVTGDYLGVTLWDISDLNDIHIVHDYEGHFGGLWHAEFSPDSSQIISASWDSEIRLWDVENQSLIKRFIGNPTAVLSASMSPDKKTIVSGSSNGTIILWDVETGEILQRLQGHNGEVYSVVFSADGEMILSASADGTTILWRIDDLPKLQHWVRENRYLPSLSCEERNSYGLSSCIDDIPPMTATFVPTSTPFR